MLQTSFTRTRLSPWVSGRLFALALSAFVGSSLWCGLPAYAGHWEISGQVAETFTQSIVTLNSPDVYTSTQTSSFNGWASNDSSAYGSGYGSDQDGECYGYNATGYDVTITPVLTWVPDTEGELPPDKLWITETASASSDLVDYSEADTIASSFTGLVFSEADGLGDPLVDASMYVPNLGSFMDLVQKQSSGSRRTLYHTGQALTFQLPTRTIHASYAFDPVQPGGLSVSTEATYYYGITDQETEQKPDTPTSYWNFTASSGPAPIHIYVQLGDPRYGTYDPTADNLPSGFHIKLWPTIAPGQKQTIATVPAVPHIVPSTGLEYFDAEYDDVNAVTNMPGFDFDNCDLIGQLISQGLWVPRYVASAFNDAGESDDSIPGDYENSVINVYPLITGLSVNTPSITGGGTAVGTVTSGKWSHIACGADIKLHSAMATLTCDRPDVVTITPDQVSMMASSDPDETTQYAFNIATNPVSEPTSVTITALSHDGGYYEVALMVLPRDQPIILPCDQASISSLSFTSESVLGGSQATGTVTLAGAVARGGQAISLSSNSALVKVPPAVRVPEDATSASFPVTTEPVSEPQTVTISATYRGDTQTATLTLTPYAP